MLSQEAGTRMNKDNFLILCDYSETGKHLQLMSSTIFTKVHTNIAACATVGSIINNYYHHKN